MDHGNPVVEAVNLLVSGRWSLVSSQWSMVDGRSMISGQ